MKSARIKGYGSARDVIEIDQNAPVPKDPSKGKVLVKIKAAGANPIDWKISEGYLQQVMPVEFPTTLGMDFSGIVEKAGARVSDIKQGEEVYGQSSVVIGGSGAYVEMALANADNIAQKPTTLSHEEAAGLPTVGVTAWQALVEIIGISKGQKILIHGGAGGVGSIAIQLAKYIDAYVATTVDEKDKQFAKEELGADEIIDYKTQTLFAQQPQSSFTSAKQQLMIEGNSFKIDNVTFSHQMASVNDIQIHYVIGGKGEPVVLLHGWPETWYAWRHVMPALAENYAVIAPDLRGIGDSSKPLTGYDGKTLAEDIYQLVTQLGFETIFLVGHDIGGPVAYAYAVEHPSEVKKLVAIDTAIPGFVPSPSWNGELPVWFVPFHQTPDVPEALVQGKETAYLSWHFQNLAYNQAAITQADINEYVSHYSAPGGMRAGFEHYRAFPQDAIQNQNYSKTKLTTPVLAVGAGYIPLFGGNLTTSSAEYAMKILAEDVTGIIVPNSGHYIAEERPDSLVRQLSVFFGE